MLHEIYMCDSRSRNIFVVDCTKDNVLCAIFWSSPCPVFLCNQYTCDLAFMGRKYKKLMHLLDKVKLTFLHRFIKLIGRVSMSNTPIHERHEL